jgi:ribulose-bisphosphate carboxylase small chain
MIKAPVAARQQTVLTQSKTAKPAMVSNVNAKKTNAFLVWTPTDNKFFETFSFLPALTDEDISKQVAYIVGNGWTPCLEFAEPENAYTASQNSVRMGNVASGYQDNRYWTMWKLPMFGCTDGSQVLAEMKQCTKAFPDAYIRLVAFDAVRQVQMCGFLVHRPPQCSEYKKPENRSVA